MGDLTQRTILAGILDAEMREVTGRELAPMLDFAGDDVVEGGVSEEVEGAAGDGAVYMLTYYYVDFRGHVLPVRWDNNDLGGVPFRGGDGRRYWCIHDRILLHQRFVDVWSRYWGPHNYAP
jgi:hypothetical protein